MSFIWPPALLLLVLVPLGVWAARAIESGRRRRAGALSGLGRGASVGPPSRRARLASGLVLLGMVVMVVALARPQGTVALPGEAGTVILAFDVSGSMAATDLQPTRMAAARAAASAFVERQPRGVAVGIVAFSDSGLSVQAPSTDQDTVQAAISRLQPERGTSLGQGIEAAVAAVINAEAPPGVDYYTREPATPAPSPAPVPAGSHASAAIVLLTDGENNERPDPLAMAQVAADRGIRIDTVGIGSEAGVDLDINGFHVHTQLDADLLKQIAQLTGGDYYSADSTADLVRVYAGIDPRLVIKPQQIELTGLFAGASLLLLVAGSLGSLAWMGRLP